MFVANSQRKRPLGRQKRRWGDKFKLGLKEVWYEGVDWIQLSHDRVY
jgi:hypothetical protein